MRLAWAALLAMLVLTGGCAGRRGRAGHGWDALGTRTVQGRTDMDVIHVGRSDTHFRQLQFLVTGSAMELYDLRIVFGDGETWSPATRLVFSPDEWSRVLDVPGNARVIGRVEFRYGNLPDGGRARVRLFGR